MQKKLGGIKQQLTDANALLKQAQEDLEQAKRRKQELSNEVARSSQGMTDKQGSLSNLARMHKLNAGNEPAVKMVLPEVESKEKPLQAHLKGGKTSKTTDRDEAESLGANLSL
jgi:chromosome segregation ATPase